MLNTSIKDYINEMNRLHSQMRIKKEDVFGSFDSETYTRISDGMIVARTDDTCPIFKDIIPYKSVTIVCNPQDYNEVCYWLNYVQGAGTISQQKTLTDGRIAIRSNYMCW